MKIFVSLLVASSVAQEYYYDYDNNTDSAAEWIPESSLPQGKSDPYANSYPAADAPMTCWHCDAMSFEECEQRGQERPCHDNQAYI